MLEQPGVSSLGWSCSQASDCPVVRPAVGQPFAYQIPSHPPMSRTMSPCSTPGCAELVRGGGACVAHRRTWHKTQQRKRGTAAQRGYDGMHRRWRRMILAKHPLCQACESEGRTTPATVADHIIPISQGGLKLDLNNGQGLCASCHGKKTLAEGSFGRW